MQPGAEEPSLHHLLLARASRCRTGSEPRVEAADLLQIPREGRPVRAEKDGGCDDGSIDVKTPPLRAGGKYGTSHGSGWTWYST